MAYSGNETVTVSVHYCPRMILSSFRSGEGDLLLWDKTRKKAVRKRVQDTYTQPFWYYRDEKERAYIPKECFLDLAFPGITIAHLLEERESVPVFFHRLFPFLNTLSFVSWRYGLVHLDEEIRITFRRSSRSVHKENHHLGELYAAADENLYTALDYVDLKSAVLHSPPTRTFLLGDLPVVQMNPWYMRQYSYIQSSHRDIGYIALYPVTPHDCLVLYDGSTYRLEDSVLSEDDMDYINTMSSLQSVSFIYTEGFDLERFIYIRKVRTEKLMDFVQNEGNPSFPFADLSVLPAVRKNCRGGGRSKERPTLVEREDDDSYRFWWNDDDEEELAEYRQRCWKELEDAASAFITAGTEN